MPTVALQDQTAQAACGVGSGIDINAVGMHFGFCHRRMAVDDDLAKRQFGLKEFIADPEQIFVRLLCERYTWTNSGMNEKIVAAGERLFQLFKEPMVGVRY